MTVLEDHFRCNFAAVGTRKSVVNLAEGQDGHLSTSRQV